MFCMKPVPLPGTSVSSVSLAQFWGYGYTFVPAVAGRAQIMFILGVLTSYLVSHILITHTGVKLRKYNTEKHLPLLTNHPQPRHKTQHKHTHISPLHLSTRGVGKWTLRIREDLRLTRVAAVDLRHLRQRGVAEVHFFHQNPGTSSRLSRWMIVKPSSIHGAGRLQETKFTRAVVHVLARSLRRPVRRGGRQTRELRLGGPHVPQRQEDGSLQKWRQEQR